MLSCWHDHRQYDSNDSKILRLKINMSIVISKNGREAQIVERSNVDKEDFLQEYIHNNPEVIPIYEIQEDKKLYIARREFPTNSGPIDALAVDEVGNIYVIETKLYKNPDKRTVVAQALDYGAALWKHFTDFHHFIDILDQDAQKNFQLSFAEKVQEFFDFDEDGYESFLDRLRRGLNDGDIKFVILMDSMDERLKTLIHYVNQNSQFDIYAVRLEFYNFNDHEIIIPKIFGVDVKKNVRGNASEKQWDEVMFFKEFERKGLTQEALVAKQILDWSSKRSSRIYWGKGIATGSFVPVHSVKDSDHHFFALSTSGNIQIYFQWMQKRTSFKSEGKRFELLNHLNSIPGVSLSQNSITKRPSIKLSVLAEGDNVEKFLDIYCWFLKQIKQ